ncbi:MAG TPA: trypsin-like peptidase domain-containing protein [Mycobacteriales bacterium]|nr:trypsin-like peptidase domain-containing protein [Mycobacteriales bacterium]
MTDGGLGSGPPPAPWWSPQVGGPEGSIPVVGGGFGVDTLQHRFGEAPAPGGRTRAWVVGSVALVAALIGGAIGGAIGAADGSSAQGGTSSSTSLGAPPVTTTSRPSGSVAAVAAAVLPSVVSIQVQSSTVSDTGSGVILTRTGYILTNNHVVEAAAGGGGTIAVTLENQPTLEIPGTIVGRDQKSDLAVVKISAGSALPAAVLGNSAALRVGDPVIAIGAPLGLAGTVTTGIVSALDRPVLPNPESTTAVASALDAIQTDAPINPGNSGGALVNSSGQVIGINTAIATLGASGSPFAQAQQSGSIGLGFAIPMNYARTIAEQLIRTGHAVHPLMGVSVYSGSQCPNSGAALPANRNGALVCSVQPGSPAARAGLQAGDLVIGFDNQPITSADTLVAFTRVQQIGSKHTITYLRHGQVRTTTVTLGSDAG